MGKEIPLQKYCSCLKAVESSNAKGKGYNAYAVCRASVHGLKQFGRIACFPYPHEVSSTRVNIRAKKPSLNWMQFVKKIYAEDDGLTYKEALIKAAGLYNKKKHK